MRRGELMGRERVKDASKWVHIMCTTCSTYIVT